MSTENQQEGILKVANLTRDLPCRDDCEYELDCSIQYRRKKNNCRGRIDDYIAADIYGEPQENIFSDDTIEFETINPKGTVKIKEGIARISR